MFVSGLTFNLRGAQQTQPFAHPLDGKVRRDLTGAHSVSAVAFTGTHCQAVGLFTQPLHSCFSAIRGMQGLFQAIAFKLDLIACRVALKSARAVEILNSNFVLPLAAGEVKKGSLRPVPLAKPLVGLRSRACTSRTRCVD